VGDEAIVCARVLSGVVDVVVGPTRQAAVDLAHARGAEVIVLDGPLRAGERAAPGVLALLALDAIDPWGSGRVPPAGDLRAAPEALLALADRVVHVDPAPPSVPRDLGARVGLFTALARPARLVRALERSGVALAEVISAPDHGPVDARLRERLRTTAVSAWLATEKCALHLRDVPLAAPLEVLSGALVLAPEIVRALLELRARPDKPAQNGQ